MSTTDHSTERYTHGHHESVLRSHSWRTVDNSAAYLAPYLRPGQRVLDIGSGPGTLTIDLARRVAPGEVVGVDASEEIVEHASALAQDDGIASVSFRTGSAYALDFEDDSFDVVHAHQVLQHVADPVAVLKEMRRVTRSGGLVAARDVDYGGVMVAPGLPGLGRWRTVYDAVHRSNGGEPDAGRHLKGWALEAGLTEVRSTASVWCFASDAEREWWGGSWADRALHSDFAGQAVEAGIATLTDLEAISEGWRLWIGEPAGWMAMPHGEIVATA